MTTDQLSIFDVMDTAEAGTTCPLCGWSWTGKGSFPLARHIEGSNGWAFGGSEAGKCENQKIYLYRVGAQQHFGLRLRDNEPNTTYKNDLLAVILEAKQQGCTDKQIQKVLKRGASS
ncbi:hypothetical protein 4C_0043 [Brevibacterium phage 4C]|uniref:Uncharacterized protein n=31 Tax=Agmunavirus AGM1 TaxID=2843882 RepID=A0A7D0GHS4_9CAUD|nr:hypothetical protein KMC77_gp43 [Brevibacterium phage AGM1]QDH85686.1 hypothetical protein AGM2_0043 [Brevibacterium phage AGM2]QDH85739.1 hypothetical protein AGM3_0043 [Brevibacterium phage AGM3]QDH85792.1 hypothetical protein AGM4_0043 [Brevibacterium phage AGM4]QDH85845.1 hypothetical protein AGM5_0043 [Brevibacterium phage AGM5]QDH85898.1 hypothetical protein AGM6_0043 [Brevibacterium phage AGM6]QDH85951.1 hypothetical protein AGM7_0043 [Brevibacterium phage AGM7]QDH86004.1 hypotheti